MAGKYIYILYLKFFFFLGYVLFVGFILVGFAVVLQVFCCSLDLSSLSRCCLFDRPIVSGHLPVLPPHQRVTYRESLRTIGWEGLVSAAPLSRTALSLSQTVCGALNVWVSYTGPILVARIAQTPNITQVVLVVCAVATSRPADFGLWEYILCGCCFPLGTRDAIFGWRRPRP